MWFDPKFFAREVPMRFATFPVLHKRGFSILRGHLKLPGLRKGDTRVLEVGPGYYPVAGKGFAAVTFVDYSPRTVGDLRKAVAATRASGVREYADALRMSRNPAVGEGYAARRVAFLERKHSCAPASRTRFSFVRGDARSLPVAGGSHDVALASEVFTNDHRFADARHFSGGMSEPS